MTRRMAWLLGGVLAAGALGCGGQGSGGAGNTGGGGATPDRPGQKQDRDGDGFVDDADCAPDNRDAWRQVQVYADIDGDQYGSGEARSLCVGAQLPPGFTPQAGDCDPSDASLWTLLAYRWRDRDADGAFVSEEGTVCGGFDLPAGYTSTPPAVLDCDDTRAEVKFFVELFLDEDGDGVGAGPRARLCAASPSPVGYSSQDTDCAPQDASRWQAVSRKYRDADGDGYTVDLQGAICLGNSTQGYPDTSRGPDCDDTRAEVFQALSSYVDQDGDGVGAGQVLAQCTDGTRPRGYVATGHDCDDTRAAVSQWLVVYPDQDSDGVGAPPRAVMCLASSTPPAGYSIYGFDPDDNNPAVREDPQADADLIDPPARVSPGGRRPQVEDGP